MLLFVNKGEACLIRSCARQDRLHSQISVVEIPIGGSIESGANGRPVLFLVLVSQAN